MKRVIIMVMAVTILSLKAIFASTFTSGTPELLKRWTGIGMIGTVVATAIAVTVLTVMKHRAHGN